MLKILVVGVETKNIGARCCVKYEDGNRECADVSNSIPIKDIKPRRFIMEESESNKKMEFISN
jgi:hypothetical protein